MENKIKRVFLIVLDSFGIGELPDANEYSDVGSNTFRTIYNSPKYKTPNLEKLGLFNIDGNKEIAKPIENPTASFARLAEKSKGKDTTIGHWEIAGVVSETPLPTYKDGFPMDLIDNYCKKIGHGFLCNKPYSGTKVLEDFGEEHMKSGKVIIYTSADSVFQVAAHEDVIPTDKLYEFCEIAREMLVGEHGVGRVIARPFTGKVGEFKRTSKRHDFSILPPKKTILDTLCENNLDVIGVGKIADIFANQGITESTGVNIDNADGINKTILMIDKEFSGLCFVNLVDFDMVYGHRNDIDGYANAMTYFDLKLPEFLEKMKDDDVLMITADHGCDPSTPSTDHSREYVPLLIYGKQVKKGVDLGTLNGFSVVGSTIKEMLGIESDEESVFTRINI